MMKNNKLTFRRVLGITMLLLLTTVVFGQDKSKRPSPPAQVSDTIDGTIITIDYSRPSVKGRKIFGGLEPYGKVWRTGANEATWIEVSDDVQVEGKSLPKGKYGLFTIPGENEWTIIFNTAWDQWGAFNYDQGKDVLRVNVKPTVGEEFTEQFTIAISEQGVVSLKWADVKVDFEIST